MRYIKVLSVISLVVLSVGLINLGDTSAGDNHGLPKVSISKDAEPNLVPVELNEMGIMTASWYGPRFHGKTTANGEIYNQMALTAAHKSLPFGTLLQITNFRNGKSIIVRINDRGPYIDGRDLDLSKGTAKTLGILHKGVVRVKVQEIVINSDTQPASTLN
ncbi:MAG: rare lipoprotein A [Stygiobacter sp.]|nr:MAG: rare lipoprotein A [Stygiobacter sp.]KAF0218239.1 MAG: rare lipoprotein [Ignavibacteria bacterium]